MDYHANDWLGRWQNFESYLTSADPVLMKAWQEAEEAVASMKMPMFRAVSYTHLTLPTTPYV